MMASIPAGRGERCTRSPAHAPSGETTPTRGHILASSRGRPAAYAGLLFTVLSLLSLGLLRDLPSTGASDEELAGYYTGSSQRSLVVIGLYLVPFAGIAFCWFVSALRDRFISHAGIEDHLLSSMQLLGGVLFVAITFVSAAALASPALAAEIGDAAAPAPSPGTTRQMLVLGEALRMVFALRAAAVFMIAGTTRARRAGLMPRWLVVVSYIGALVLLVSASYVPGLQLIFPLWVAAVSVLTSDAAPVVPA